MDVDVTLNHVDSYAGQHVFEVAAHAGHELAGTMVLNIFDDEIFVCWIEVFGDFRGNGVAGGMLARVQNQFPSLPVNFGMLTEDGAEMVRRLRMVEKRNAVYDEAKARVPALESRIRGFEKLADTLAAVPEGERAPIMADLDAWNEVADELELLKETLEREQPVFRFIDTRFEREPSPEQPKSMGP